MESIREPFNATEYHNKTAHSQLDLEKNIDKTEQIGFSFQILLSIILQHLEVNKNNNDELDIFDNFPVVNTPICRFVLFELQSMFDLQFISS